VRFEHLYAPDNRVVVEKRYVGNKSSTVVVDLGHFDSHGTVLRPTEHFLGVLLARPESRDNYVVSFVIVVAQHFLCTQMIVTGTFATNMRWCRFWRRFCFSGA
jgi:hypothetical protein